MARLTALWLSVAVLTTPGLAATRFDAMLQRQLGLPGISARTLSATQVPRQSDLIDTDVWQLPVLPLVWWNDASDITLGLRVRTDMRGDYDRWTVEVHRGFGGFESATLGESVDFFVQYANPSWLLRDPNLTLALEGWSEEGAVGAAARIEHHRVGEETVRGRRIGGAVRWMATRNTLFLDPELWENAGTVEASGFVRWIIPAGNTRWTVNGDVTGGIGYRRAQFATAGEEYDANAIGRARAAGAVRHRVGRFVLGVRAFLGVANGVDRLITQRGIPVNGADPYETFRNPLVRSQGAPFVGRDFFYHSPGNANLRGYRPGLVGRWAVAGSVEVEGDVVRADGPFRRLSVVGFWDGGAVDTLSIAQGNDAFRSLSNVGAGVRAWFRVLGRTFPVRVEFPFYVSSPFYAHNTEQGREQWGFRWLVSLEPSF